MADTRALVFKRYGAGQLDVLRPVLRAVSTRLSHAQIHFFALKEVTSKHIETPLENGASMLELFFTADDEIGANNLFFDTCEAHIFACMQALHAVADNLAHVLYYSLGWNHEGKPPKRKVCLHTVSARLVQLGHKRPEFLSISGPLELLKQDASYVLLSDATNHIKHHGGLQAKLNWDGSTENQYKLLTSAFNREHAEYPQREVLPFLESAYAVMSKTVVDTGCALHEWLREKVTRNEQGR